MAVIALPGVSRPDLERDCDVAAVLNGAATAPLIDVVVIGREISGEFYIAGTHADADKAIAIMMRGVQMLASGKQVNEPSDEASVS